MAFIRTLSAALLVLGTALAAQAQVVDRAGVPYRRWDVHGAFGLHLTDTRDAGHVDRTDRDDDLNGTGIVGFDVGRYWNSHLKTEVGLQLRPDWSAYGSEPVRLPSGQMVNGWYETRIALTQFSGGVTWQFLENTFAHPYVTAGARVGVASTDRQRQLTAWVYDGVRSIQVQVPPDRAQSVHVIVRPYAAFGFKSYFNERAFVRPEISTAANGDGLSQATFRLGFGVDF